MLATETLPVKLPAVEGVNVAVKVAVCPGVRIVPLGTPLALKPAPDTVIPDIVTVDVPVLVSVTVLVPVLGMFTLPKASEDALEFSTSVPPLTVRIAELLFAVPALLLTVTANCALLSPVVSAGVV